MRLGIYPGTFDPVHNGHIALAKEALEQCELDRLIFLPEAAPRYKAEVTGLTHRLTMLQRAITGQLALSVIGLHSQQFSVAETLPEIKRLFPGAKYTLLVGSDTARTFGGRWPGLAILFAEMDLAIGLRGTDTEAQVLQIMEAFPDARYRILAAPYRHASSSLSRGSSQPDDIPPAVAAYITEQCLYM